MKAIKSYLVMFSLACLVVASLGTTAAEARSKRWVGPAVAAGVAGLVIGGALAANARPRAYHGGYEPAYYAPQPTYYAPQPVHYAPPAYHYQPAYTYRPYPVYAYGTPPTARYAYRPGYYVNGYAWRPARTYHHVPAYADPYADNGYYARPRRSGLSVSVSVGTSRHAPRPVYRTTCQRDYIIDRHGRQVLTRTCR